jgi:hypothetical protein
MGDILGIRYEAIAFLFELYDIIDNEERRELFEKIMLLDGIRAKIRSKELITRKQESKPEAKK